MIIDFHTHTFPDELADRADLRDRGNVKAETRTVAN